MIKGLLCLALGGTMNIKKLAALVMAGVLCMSAFVGCGVNPEKTVATLGDQNVTFEMANFMCKYQKATADDMYAMYAEYYGVDSLWDVDMTGAGTTMEEDLKSSVMDMLHELYTLKAHMADYEVTITEEEEAAIKEAAAAFMEGNSEEAIEEFGASEEVVAELLTLYTIQAKMYDAIIADVDRVVSDEEANMRGYSYIALGLDGEYDDEGSYVEYTEAQIEAIKANADSIAADLKDADMETVAEKYGYEVETSTYEKDDEYVEEELLDALDALKEGEVSGLVETESTLYFVRIDTDTDEEATEENRVAIVEERESAMYDEVLAGWQEEDGWTVEEKLIEQIDFHNIFTQVSESTEDTEDTEELLLEETEAE